MAEIPPGVTRYPLRVGIDPKFALYLFAPIGAILFIVCLAGAVYYGGSWPALAALVVLGVLLPPLTLPLPWWAQALIPFGLLVGLLAVTGADEETTGSYVLALLGAFSLGGVVLWWRITRRRWAVRLASAEGAPASGLDPVWHRDVGVVLATWRDEEFDYEAVDPDLDVVLGAVRALGRPEHTVVMIYRGRARMDVGGRADGSMVVQQADDRRRWNDGFQVADPDFDGHGTPQRGTPHEMIAYAGARSAFPMGLITSLEAAESAVRTWLESGTREESLTWWTRSQGQLGVPRPSRLREQDRPGSTISVDTQSYNFS